MFLIYLSIINTAVIQGQLWFGIGRVPALHECGTSRWRAWKRLRFLFVLGGYSSFVFLRNPYKNQQVVRLVSEGMLTEVNKIAACYGV